jgi:hypothetical protein
MLQAVGYSSLLWRIAVTYQAQITGCRLGRGGINTDITSDYVSADALTHKIELENYE